MAVSECSNPPKYLRSYWKGASFFFFFATCNFTKDRTPARVSFRDLVHHKKDDLWRTLIFRVELHFSNAPLIGAFPRGSLQSWRLLLSPCLIICSVGESMEKTGPVERWNNDNNMSFSSTEEIKYSYFRLKTL